MKFLSLCRREISRGPRGAKARGRRTWPSIDGEDLLLLGNVAQLEKTDRSQGLARRRREIPRDQQRIPGQLGLLFEPTGEIDGWADDRAVEPMRRADIAVADIAEMKRQPEAQRLLAVGTALLVQLGHRRKGVSCGLQRRPATCAEIVGLRRENRQHTVADEFENLAAGALDRPDHALEPLVQDLDERGERQRVGHPGEAAQIAVPDRGMDGLAVAAPDLATDDVLAGAAPDIGVDDVDGA